jgi:hypothetical protein
LPDIALLDVKIAEATAAIKDDAKHDKRLARERKEDLMRLKRVEQIYVSGPFLPSYHVSNIE